MSIISKPARQPNEAMLCAADARARGAISSSDRRSQSSFASLTRASAGSTSAASPPPSKVRRAAVALAVASRCAQPCAPSQRSRSQWTRSRCADRRCAAGAAHGASLQTASARAAKIAPAELAAAFAVGLLAQAQPDAAPASELQLQQRPSVPALRLVGFTAAIVGCGAARRLASLRSSASSPARWPCAPLSVCGPRHRRRPPRRRAAAATRSSRRRRPSRAVGAPPLGACSSFVS